MDFNCDGETERSIDPSRKRQRNGGEMTKIWGVLEEKEPQLDNQKRSQENELAEDCGEMPKDKSTRPSK